MFEYMTISCPPQLRGRILTLTPREYGAVLLQAYLGKVNLKQIADFGKLRTGQLVEWRRQPEFLLAMDWSKDAFSKEFQETIILNDYTVTEYHEIAAEFSLLEESLRVSTRIPLYHRFKSLGQKLISKKKYNLEMDRYDLVLFKRLFAFFYSLEHHWPSPASRRIEEDFKPFAEDTVWPAVTGETWIDAELKQVQHSEPLSELLDSLSKRLKSIFEYFPAEMIR